MCADSGPKRKALWQINAESSRQVCKSRKPNSSWTEVQCDHRRIYGTGMQTVFGTSRFDQADLPETTATWTRASPEHPIAHKNKNPPDCGGVLQNKIAGGQIAIFKSLAARKATLLLALILIASPVIGLRPMRAARLRTSRMPSPAIFTRSPFFQVLGDRPMRSSSICKPCFLLS